MVRSAKIIVALLCITCVLALCIAPYVDIPVTVLKSLQIVLLLMFSLAAGALFLISTFLFQLALFRYAIRQVSLPTLIITFLLPIETNCVQQC